MVSLSCTKSIISSMTAVGLKSSRPVDRRNTDPSPNTRQLIALDSNDFPMKSTSRATCAPSLCFTPKALSTSAKSKSW